MRAYAAIGALLLTTCWANAGMITFEDLTPYQSGGTVTGNFSSGGFDFTLVGQSATVVNDSLRQDCSPACPDDGTNFVLAPFGENSSGTAFPPSKLVMSAPGGNLFSLTSFDGTGSFGGSAPKPTDLVVSGIHGGGSSFTEEFAIDPTLNQNNELSFQHFVPSSEFQNLASVTFSSTGAPYSIYDGFSIDNIGVADSAQGVAEPGALALFGIGAVCLIATHRRRANRTTSQEARSR